MRFVIADDSAIPRTYAKRVLIQAGHEVVAEAANGLEAIALCKEHAPDVALLDIAMPLMTGDQAAQTIFVERLAAHIVLASSQSQDAIIAPLLAIGCRFVGKPYQPEQLTKVVEEIARGAA